MTPRAVCIAALALCLGLACTVTPRAVAAPVQDHLPFQISFGRLRTAPTSLPAVLFWFEGGRLHLRVLGDGTPRRYSAEIRTSKAGAFQDVYPTSERARPRQPRPSKMFVDIRADGTTEEGIDVSPSADFRQVTLDILIDGQRRPEAVYIGELGKHPLGLPVKIRIAGIRDSVLDRLGF